MPIRMETYITRRMLRAEPETLFAFGDNLIGKGMGGQARQMRGEPNAVGIPTKKLPAMDESAFFSDADTDSFLDALGRPLDRLSRHLQAGGVVVWPAAGIGTGLADLERRAPRIWASLQRAQERLEAL